MGTACPLRFCFKNTKEFRFAQLLSRVHVSAEQAPSRRGWASSEKLNVLPSLGRDPPPREFYQKLSGQQGRSG